MVESAMDGPANSLIAELSRLAEQRGCSVATAESLTGGQLAAALSAAHNAARWYRGGAVAYHPAVKHELLEAPPGPVVTADTAEAMARRAVELFGADCAAAVTGVGGPDPEEGKPAGTVWLASCTRTGGTRKELHRFTGRPLAVMEQTIQAALCALIDRLREEP